MKRSWYFGWVAAAVFLAACGGSSSSEDAEGPSVPASSVSSATIAPSAPAAESPSSTATTAAPQASPTTTGLDAEKWTHEVCLLAGQFQKTAIAADTALNAISTDAADAQAKLVAEYDRIEKGLDAYVAGVTTLPAPTDAGGTAIKALWIKLATESQQHAASNAKQVRELPSGAEFADAYFELTTDYRLDQSDQELRGDLEKLEVQFPAARKVIEAIDNDAACRGVVDG